MEQSIGNDFNLFILMRRILSVILSFSAILIAGEGDILEVNLIFTNEIQGSIHQVPARFMNPEYPPLLTGGAGAYTYVNSVRDGIDSPVLLLDGGDFFQGTPLGTHDAGKSIITWMNWMQYDALVPGVFDFILGRDALAHTASTAHFPFLAANIIEKETGKNPDFVKPYILKEIDGVTFGIIGLASPMVKDQIVAEKYEGLIFQSPLEVLDRWVSEVKTQGADIVILLSSLGLPYERESVFDEFTDQIDTQSSEMQNETLDAIVLAHYAKGVDIIVTGGVSKGYDTPWIDPETHVLVVQNYGNITGIGHLILQIDRNVKTLTGYQYPTKRGMMISLLEDDVAADPVIADSISNWVENSTSPLHFLDDTIKDAVFIEQNTTLFTMDNFNIPAIGTADRMDIMTWNLEWFPAAGDTTIEYVSEVLHDLNLDIVALQEIKNMGWFGKLMEQIPEYGYILTKQSSFLNQAIIYRKENLAVLDYYEPFAMDDYFFAGRPPLLVNFAYNDGHTVKVFTVVNLHLKCCGDGLYRRQRSLEWLHDYLLEYMAVGQDRIVVLGDLNDQLDDEPVFNSFYPFLDDPANFYFVTESIHDDASQASYPSWPSFLDHIIIGKGFFNDHQQSGSIQTVQVDDYVGSWELYESTMSDHLPVLWSFKFK